MVFHSPWDQPAYKKAKKKAVTRKKSKKKAKKAPAHKAKAPAHKAKKIAKKVPCKKAPRARKSSTGDTGPPGGWAPAWVIKAVDHRKTYHAKHAVPASFFKRAATAAYNKTFKHKGSLFYPLLVLSNYVKAAKLVPASKWKGRTYTEEHCSGVVPGHLRKVKGKEFVQAEFHAFVLKGSGLDR